MWYDVVSESRFPMDGDFDICQHFVDGYVQVVNSIIMFFSWVNCRCGWMELKS